MMWGLRISRFITIWLLYVLAHHLMTIFVVASTILYYPYNYTVAWAATIFTPFLSFVFFFWLFRKMKQVKAVAMFVIPLIWVVVFLASSTGISPVLYGAPWHTAFTDLSSIITAVFIYLSGVLAAWLRTHHKTPGRGPEVDFLHSEMLGKDTISEADTPSERSQAT